MPYDPVVLSLDTEICGYSPLTESPNELDWRHRFVEDMGGLVLVHGAPRALMRVLGWMVVCEPAEQTATDVQDTLGLSAGSVSTAVCASSARSA